MLYLSPTSRTRSQFPFPWEAGAVFLFSASGPESWLWYPVRSTEYFVLDWKPVRLNYKFTYMTSQPCKSYCTVHTIHTALNVLNGILYPIPRTLKPSNHANASEADKKYLLCRQPFYQLLTHKAWPGMTSGTFTAFDTLHPRCRPVFWSSTSRVASTGQVHDIHSFPVSYSVRSLPTSATSHISRAL